jgi:hypothetical protein
MTIFTHPTRPTQMLLKVTARVGDNLWILTNGEQMGTVSPTTREAALRYLTPENGWTMREVTVPKFDIPAS